MPIEFRCNQCSQLLRVPEDSAGKHARCPRCQALMPVPQPEAGGAGVPPARAAETAAPQKAPAETPAVTDGPFAPAPLPAAVPAAPATDNPFGEFPGERPFSGPATSNLNPYASPTTYASYRPTTDAYGRRLGLPWDTQPRTLGCWFRTLGAILGSPNDAFAMMHQTGGLGAPIRYNVYGLGIPAAALIVMATPFFLMLQSNLPRQQTLAQMIGGFVLGMGFTIAIAALYVLFVATIGNMFAAAIWHLFLMMVGGAKQPYETTFRVTSYVYGSLMALSLIPYIGCVASIAIIVLLIIGLAKAHEIPMGKAVMAVLVPFGLCVGAYIALIAVFFAGPYFMEAMGR